MHNREDRVRIIRKLVDYMPAAEALELLKLVSRAQVTDNNLLYGLQSMFEYYIDVNDAIIASNNDYQLSVERGAEEDHPF